MSSMGHSLRGFGIGAGRFFYSACTGEFVSRSVGTPRYTREACSNSLPTKAHTQKMCGVYRMAGMTEALWFEPGGTKIAQTW